MDDDSERVWSEGKLLTMLRGFLLQLLGQLWTHLLSSPEYPQLSGLGRSLARCSFLVDGRCLTHFRFEGASGWVWVVIFGAAATIAVYARIFILGYRGCGLPKRYSCPQVYLAAFCGLYREDFYCHFAVTRAVRALCCLLSNSLEMYVVAEITNGREGTNIEDILPVLNPYAEDIGHSQQ